jgi:hypothetical protein
MFCIERNKDMIRIYNYIKNNRIGIQNDIKLLNEPLVKDIMKKVILSYDFTDIRIDLFKIYNEIYNNNNINKKIKVIISLFLNCKNNEEIFKLYYNIINDRYFYITLLSLFNNLKIITECINIIKPEKINRKYFDKLINILGNNVEKLKRYFNVDMYTLLINMGKIYDNPLERLKIRLGKMKKIDKIDSNDIYLIFSKSYPEAKLDKFKPEDRIGIMYYVVKHKL